MLTDIQRTKALHSIPVTLSKCYINLTRNSVMRARSCTHCWPKYLFYNRNLLHSMLVVFVRYRLLGRAACCQLRTGGVCRGVCRGHSGRSGYHVALLWVGSVPQPYALVTAACQQRPSTGWQQSMTPAQCQQIRCRSKMWLEIMQHQLVSLPHAGWDHCLTQSGPLVLLANLALRFSNERSTNVHRLHF